MGGLTRAIVGACGAIAVVSVVGCAVREAPDPFRAPREGPVGEGVTTHFVRFQVSCDTCSVRWSVGQSTGSLVERALWSDRIQLRLRPGETARAALSALPSAGAGAVRYVRIYVDGELAAETRGDDEGESSSAPGSGSLSAATIVPLPASGGG